MLCQRDSIRASFLNCEVLHSCSSVSIRGEKTLLPAGHSLDAHLRCVLNFLPWN